MKREATKDNRPNDNRPTTARPTKSDRPKTTKTDRPTKSDRPVTSDRQRADRRTEGNGSTARDEAAGSGTCGGDRHGHGRDGQSD